MPSFTVPVLHPVARRILQLLGEESDRDAELADLILTDAALTLHVLAEANRAVAPTGGGITSVPVALQVIGRGEIRALVERLVATATLGTDEASLELHRHALVTSLVCESLARVVGSVDVATARVAGLLHDLGAWDPRIGHDGDTVHAWHGARMLRRLSLPRELCRAVAEHHAAAVDPVADHTTELTKLLTMADRVATALCVTSRDDTHSPNVEDGVVPRLRVLARLAMDRAGREVADSLLVLGTLLGIRSLTLEGLIDEWRRLGTADVPWTPPPAGLSRDLKRALAIVRHVTAEPEAIRSLISVVRNAPGARSVLLILDEAGEAMLEGHPDKRPYFLRVSEVSRVCENFAAFVNGAYRRGAGLYRRDEAWACVFDVFQAEAILAVPIRVAQTPIGLIISANPGEQVTGAAAESLGLVARATGEVLETLQLSRGSYLLAERIATDALTGVFNRGSFFERFAAEVRAANRYRRPLSLVMIDIDHFKKWNDAYGHQVGDRILADISKTIRESAREGDVVGRYGGDEFVVALPGCDGEHAATFAERVRARVHGLGALMHDSCYDLALSVSVGIASTTTWPCETDVLLFRADHALYRAKERGRNLVCADST